VDWDRPELFAYNPWPMANNQRPIAANFHQPLWPAYTTTSFRNRQIGAYLISLIMSGKLGCPNTKKNTGAYSLKLFKILAKETHSSTKTLWPAYTTSSFRKQTDRTNLIGLIIMGKLGSPSNKNKEKTGAYTLKLFYYLVKETV
jgi:hypothetical protein